MIQLLAVLVLAGASAEAQQMYFYEWNPGSGSEPQSVGQKITNNTLVAGQLYVLGVDSRIDDQRESLIAQGLTEVVNTNSDSRIWSFPNNSFWKTSGTGSPGGDLTMININFGNGWQISGHGTSSSWIYREDGLWGSFFESNSYNPPLKVPSFTSINYTQPVVYSTEGSYNIELSAIGAFTIWNGSPTTRYENPVSLTTNVNVVPEPSSLSLLLAGGAVLMAGRRRNS